MGYDLVIFDFDGTLADSGPWMRRVLNDVARLYGFRVLADHEFDELRHKEPRAVLGALGISTWKLPFIARHMRKRIATSAHEIALFPGVHELLAKLHTRGVVIAMVSSNAEANIRTILGPTSAGLIRHYACGAGLFGKAPKFRKVLRASRVTPSRAIGIGDEVRDIQAASDVGIAAGAVSWGIADPGFLRTHGPAFMFERIEDIPAIVCPP